MFGTDNPHLSLITIRKILLTLFSFRSQSDFLRSQNRCGYDDGIIFSSRLIPGFIFLQVSFTISFILFFLLSVLDIACVVIGIHLMDMDSDVISYTSVRE